MFNRYLNDEKILSTFGTIFIHFILVILFLLIQIKFSPVIEEFTEVSLAGGFEAPPLERLNESPVETEELQQMDDVAFVGMIKGIGSLDADVEDFFQCDRLA